MQNHAAGQVQNHKSSFRYSLNNNQNAGETEPDLCDAVKDIQVPPVAPHVTPVFYASGSYHPQDVWFDQFHDHDESTPGVHHSNASFQGVPHRVHRRIEASLSKVIKIINQKEATIEHIESMDVAICTKHSPIMLRGNLTTLQDKMMVVEVHMFLLMEMDTTLVPPVASYSTITKGSCH